MGYDMYAFDAATGERVEGDREETYFRLNIWGMGEARDRMAYLGMLVPSTGPTGEEWYALPEWTEAEWEAFYAGNTPMQAERLRLLSAHYAEREGIPCHKLCSNDGWVLTPAEIKAALVKVDRSGPQWWADWIAYLERWQERGIEVS